MQVMTAFVITGWITTFMAAVAAADTEEYKQFILELTTWAIAHGISKGSGWPRAVTNMQVPIRVAHHLIAELCDIQIVTGLGIVIAAFPQLSTITYYHQQLIVSYWNMTLNSYWAAADFNTGADNLSRVIRVAGVLCSVTLSAAFQTIVCWKEKYYWSRTEPGRCYRYHDASSCEFWTVGLWIYAFALALSLVPSPAIEPARLWVARWVGSASPVRGVCWLAGLWMARWMGRRTRRTIRGFWLLLKSLLYVWCLPGEANRLISVLFYICMAVWTTFDIADLKISNRPLVGGAEMTWGFGQILPVALLGLIFMAGIDAYAGEQRPCVPAFLSTS